MISNQKIIPYITAGDPNLEATIEMLFEFQSAGCELVELGIPFSDPSADGPSIQRSTLRSLEQGTTLEKILSALELAREKGLTIPVLLFGYLNPFARYGLERLASKSRELGIKALLILDLPVESSEGINQLFKTHDVNLIYLVTPTTSRQRLDEIERLARGFVYCVARTGITGGQTDVGDDLRNYVTRIRKHISLPIALGFGIRNRTQLNELGTLCESYVLGSVFVDLIEEFGKDASFARNQLRPLLKDLTQNYKETSC